MKKIVFLGDTLLNDELFGIQRYAYELISQLDNNATQMDYEFLIPFSAKCNLKFKNIRIVRYGKYKQGFLWRQFDFPRYVKKNKAVGVDLTLGLSVMGTDIVCLHDCIYEYYPEDFVGLKSKLRRISYLIRARINVKSAKAILTVSNTSKKEIIKFYKVKEDKIYVIYNAWQHYKRIIPDEQILENLGLEKGQFFFSLGSYLPHKNFKWIVSAAACSRDKLFVVTGSNRINNFKEYVGKRFPNIIFTGYLPDTQVKALMVNCKCFIHPSLYEGFGIPPLEALSCEADVLISNASCLPEIYGDSAVYFDASDYANIDIDLLLTKKVSDHEREKVLQKYTWKSSAYKLQQVLRKIGKEIPT